MAEGFEPGDQAAGYRGGPQPRRSRPELACTGVGHLRPARASATTATAGFAISYNQVLITYRRLRKAIPAMDLEGMARIPQKVSAIAAERDWGNPIWIDQTSAVPSSRAWRYLFEEGVVIAWGWRGPLLSVRVAQRWSDAAKVRHGWLLFVGYDRAHGSVITHRSDRFDLTFADGSSAGFYIGQVPVRTLASDYFRYGVRTDLLPTQNESAWDAIEAVKRKVTEALLPQLRQEFDAGRWVDFGALSASRDGLRYGAETFGWHDITDMKLAASGPSNADLRQEETCRSRATLRLGWRAAGGMYRSAELKAEDICNFDALEQLRHYYLRRSAD